MLAFHLISHSPLILHRIKLHDSSWWLQISPEAISICPPLLPPPMFFTITSGLDDAVASLPPVAPYVKSTLHSVAILHPTIQLLSLPALHYLLHILTVFSTFVFLMHAHLLGFSLDVIFFVKTLLYTMNPGKQPFQGPPVTYCWTGIPYYGISETLPVWFTAVILEPGIQWLWHRGSALHSSIIHEFLDKWIVLGFTKEGNGTPLQYSCLENPMDGRAWSATVHGVAKSRTRLSDFPFTFHFHTLEKEMATHSSVLAWRIPGTGELGGLLSMGSYRVGHDWSDLAANGNKLVWGRKNQTVSWCMRAK